MENVSIFDNIVRGCINKDEKARKELYNLFSAPMYNVCLRFTKEKTEAEDIFQDAFIKVFDNLHKLTNHNLLPGWIKRIFINTAIDSIRTKKMKYTSLEYYHKIDFNSINIPDSLLEKDLMSMIDDLPIKSRTVFILYVIEGYSHKEIAEIMKISEGTSKSQLFDAKVKLKQKIQKIETKEFNYKPKLKIS
jgi:RNA polymerase sigma-70 factor (ECF subfamily)